MENVKNTYSNFHKRNVSRHVYPTEWVIRTMLGQYRELKFDHSKYIGGKILDLGFGDCRNMPLLSNCGLNIYGTETASEIVELGLETLKRLKINAELKIGMNSNLPFKDNFFDFILASSSCYYVDEGTSFDDNISEIKRKLKPDGYFIANFPGFVPHKKIPDNFILENSVDLGDGHIIIKNDIYNLRNGYKFKVFRSGEQLKEYMQKDFYDISIGLCMDNYYGIQINYYIMVARKI